MLYILAGNLFALVSMHMDCLDKVDVVEVSILYIEIFVLEGCMLVEDIKLHLDSFVVVDIDCIDRDIELEGIEIHIAELFDLHNFEQVLHKDQYKIDLHMDYLVDHKVNDPSDYKD